jgi:single-strand DNA-binding protein
MADLKMPEINNVVLAGNLTKDPVFRQTTSGTSVVNFYIASNKKYRGAANHLQEEVCYIGIVAWNKLADSCNNRLKKGSAVLIDGELQSHVFRHDDGMNRNIIEIKARRIQFLNKKIPTVGSSSTDVILNQTEEEPSIVEDDSFDKFLTSEESQLLKEQPTVLPQG